MRFARPRLLLAGIALLAAPVAAQFLVGKPIVNESGITPLMAIGFGTIGAGAQPVSSAAPLPTIGKQESFRLANANVVSAAATLAGGDYIFDQTCTSYGTVTLQKLGPDGVTWKTFATYSADDTGSGHGFTAASWAQVRVVLSGTTGCYAMISRVPA